MPTGSKRSRSVLCRPMSPLQLGGQALWGTPGDGGPHQRSGRKTPAPSSLGPGKGLPCLPQPPYPDHPPEAPGCRPAPAPYVGSRLPSREHLSAGDPQGNDGGTQSTRKPGGRRDESPQESRVRLWAGPGTEGAGHLHGTRAGRAPGGLVRASSE